MKRFLTLLIILAATAILAYLALRTPDTDPAAMRAKYGGEKARFVATEDGLNIHYRDEGDAEGPAIVFIHGTMASLHTWEKVVELLGSDYRLISYDQPGHGLTGPAPDNDYSASGMIRATQAVAEAAGLEQFYIAGNSMGGWIAWRYALEYPQNVAGLILIDAAGAPLRPDETEPPLNLGFRLLKMKALRPLLAQITPRSIVKRSLKDTVADDSIVDDAMIDRYWKLLRYPGNRQSAGFRADTDSEPAQFERIGEIAAPALILWGAQDRLLFPSAAKTFAEAMPNASVVVYDSVGHIPMEEAPAQVAADMRDFLRRVELRRPSEADRP